MLINQRRYYSGGVLLPSAIVILVQLILFIIRLNTHDPEYRGEFFTEHAFDEIPFVLSVINAILVMALCLPILRIDLAAKSRLMQFCYWFGLSGSWLGFLTFYGMRSASSDNSDASVFVLSNTLPYFIGLVWTYFSFRRKLAEFKNGLPDLEVITKDDRKTEQPHTPPPQAPLGG